MVHIYCIFIDGLERKDEVVHIYCILYKVRGLRISTNIACHIAQVEGIKQHKPINHDKRNEELKHVIRLAGANTFCRIVICI